jgi:non-specific serine/threonine protein kinase
LNLASGTWTTYESGHAARVYAAAATVGGAVVLTGGKATEEDAYTSSVARFDVGTGSWSDLPNLPKGVNSMALAATPTDLISVGGFTQQGASTVAFRLDLNSMRWSELPSLAVPRAGLSAAASGSRVFAVGGCCADDGASVFEWIPIPSASNSAAP